MKFKVLFFDLLVAVFMIGSAKYEIFASDTETVVENSEDVTVADEEKSFDVLSDSETDSTVDVDLILDSMIVTQEKMDLLYKELRNISAMLLILVVFETLRIVRSWSKEIGVK